ncbi:MAG: PIG-L deacetylase family protein [Nanoarchaeota archaeon]|nr:PIG-L deacetylase family protein [Nanoarchaeota archaeon]
MILGKKTAKKMKKETVVVFSAHSDDFVIGAGGTIANYTKEGKKVIVIVMSYGEKSHIWLKKSIVQKMRSAETMEACKLLKCKALFFDLREGNFPEDYAATKREQQFLDLIHSLKPVKIFTHSSEDPHPDHRATHAITLDLYEKLSYRPEVYIYSVWNPFSFKTIYPALYSNISTTLRLKLQALRTFRSQKIHLAYPLLLLLLRAVRDGFKMRGARFAEKFFRIK